MAEVNEKKTFCVIILFSIHFILKAERLLTGEQIFHDVVPIPRAIAASCGMAIRFYCHDFARINRVLETAEIEIKRLFREEAEGFYVELDKESNDYSTDENR